MNVWEITSVTEAREAYRRLVQTQKYEREGIRVRLIDLCEEALSRVTTIEEAMRIWQAAPLQSEVRATALKKLNALYQPLIDAVATIEQAHTLYLQIPYGFVARYACSRRWIDLCHTRSELRKVLKQDSRWDREARDRIGQQWGEKNKLLLAHELEKATTLPEIFRIWRTGGAWYGGRALCLERVSVLGIQTGTVEEMAKACKAKSERSLRLLERLHEAIERDQKERNEEK